MPTTEKKETEKKEKTLLDIVFISFTANTCPSSNAAAYALTSPPARKPTRKERNVVLKDDYSIMNEARALLSNPPNDSDIFVSYAVQKHRDMDFQQRPHFEKLFAIW